MRTLAPLCACLVAFGLALAQGDEPVDHKIYGCPNESGETVYQEGPCDAPQPNRKKPEKVVEPKAATAKAASKAVAKAKPQATASKPMPAPKSQSRVSHASRKSSKSQAIRPVIDPSKFSADPKWGSPERTLKTFIAAMKTGDRPLARACLVAEALDDLGPQLETLPDDSLRSTVDRYTGFVMEGDLGPYWSIRALRGRQRPAWIFFERTADGNWKIAAI
jgi:hypothetical protein